MTESKLRQAAQGLLQSYDEADKSAPVNVAFTRVEWGRLRAALEEPPAPATEPTCKNPRCRDGKVLSFMTGEWESVPCPDCNPEAPSGVEGPDIFSEAQQEAPSGAEYRTIKVSDNQGTVPVEKIKEAVSAVSGASPSASDPLTVTRADLHRLQYLSHAASDSVVTVDDDEMWDRIDRMLENGGASPSALTDEKIKDVMDRTSVSRAYLASAPSALDDALDTMQGALWNIRDLISAGQATQGWQRDVERAVEQYERGEITSTVALVDIRHALPAPPNGESQ